MLQPSRFALPRLHLHGLRLLPAPSPYRTTARSEQGGSHSRCSGSTGGGCSSVWQPARSYPRRTKNHYVDSGQNRTAHLSLACCCLLLHTCPSPSTIHLRFRSCRKVRIRLPSLFLLPLILWYFLYTTQRHLLCCFLHIHSFLRRVRPIPIRPLSAGGSRLLQSRRLQRPILYRMNPVQFPSFQGR